MSGRISGLLAGLSFFLLGSGQMLLSLRLPGGIGISAAEPGPGLFPLLVGGLMCLAAAALLVEVWKDRPEDHAERRSAPIDIMLVVATIGGYILLLPRAGFLISAFLMLMATLWIYGMPKFSHRIAAAAAATLASHVLFAFLLGVNMPEPIWFR